MSYYVNPKGQTKEQWLKENGKVFRQPSFFDIPAGHCAVCLIDNGFFSAAGIAYSQREFEAFNHPSDYRPKCWYIAPVDKLIEVEPNLSREFN